METISATAPTLFLGSVGYRTLEARGSTPLSSTRNPVGEPRRGFVFLGS